MNKRADKNLIVGLDIGTSKVVAIVGEVTEDGRIEIVGIGSHPSRGLKKGVVVGKTDARGEEPEERPVTPESLFLTVVSALGLDTTRQFKTSDGRPVRMVEESVRPVGEVLA